MLNATTLSKGGNNDYYKQLQEIEYKRLVDVDLLKSLDSPYTTKVAAYIRVSTIRQGLKDKVSLQEQESQIKDLIEKNSWKCLEVFQDKSSGKSFDSRSQFQEMITKAKAGEFDVIVAWSSDRLARNSDDMTLLRSDLRNHGVQITTVNEPTQIDDPRKLGARRDVYGKLADLFLDIKAEEDNRTRTLRFELGKKGKAKRGIIPCKTPFGYQKKFIHDERTGKKTGEEDVIVPDEARIIRLIFDFYDEKGWGMKRIASYLNEQGIPSRTFSKWGCTTIKYMLQNPTYVGSVRYGWRLSESKKSRARLQTGHKGILVPGQHKPIIEMDQYLRVQKKMKLRQKFGGRATASKGLLVGIAKCGRCGGGTYVTQYPHWYAYTKNKKDRDKYTPNYVYLCSSYSQRGKSGCSSRHVMFKNKLENSVISEIRKLANSEKSRDAFINNRLKSSNTRLSSEINETRQAISELEQSRNQQKLAYEKGYVSVDEHGRDLQRIDSQISTLRQELIEKEGELIKVEEQANRNRQALLALANFDYVWSNASFVKKKELMQSILQKVIVNKDKIEIEFVTEFSDTAS